MHGEVGSLLNHSTHMRVVLAFQLQSVWNPLTQSIHTAVVVLLVLTSTDPGERASERAREEESVGSLTGRKNEESERVGSLTK